MTRFLRYRIVVFLLILLAFAAFLVYVFRSDSLLSEALFQLQNSKDTAARLRHEILQYGILSPLLFVILQALQVIFAPIPGEASGLLGGYLFGMWPGFFYSTFGLTMGSWIAFAIGRLLDDIVRVRLHRSKIYRKFNRLVCKGDFIIPFILFLLPGFPKDSLSYMLGLSTMPLPVFLFISGVGRMPGTLMLSLQGAEVYQGNYLRLLLLLLASAAVVVPCYLFKTRIFNWLRRHSRQREGFDAAILRQEEKDD